MAYWVLQDNMFAEECFESLVNALKRFEINYSIHKVIPFGGGIVPVPEPPDEKVIVFGSYSLTNYAKQRGWKGVWLDNLKYSHQMQYWDRPGDNRMFNSRALYTTFGDISQDDLLTPKFIRPDADTKEFTGRMIDWPEYVEWRDRVLALKPEDNPTLTNNTRVLLAPKKEIWSETRCWVVPSVKSKVTKYQDGRSYTTSSGTSVVTSSGYKLGSKIRYLPPQETEKRILDFVDNCVAIWYPNEAFVMDVFDSPEGLRIGEINNINSAGGYRGDMQLLVNALEGLV